MKRIGKISSCCIEDEPYRRINEPVKGNSIGFSFPNGVAHIDQVVIYRGIRLKIVVSKRQPKRPPASFPYAFCRLYRLKDSMAEGCLFSGNHPQQRYVIIFNFKIENIRAGFYVLVLDVDIFRPKGQGGRRPIPVQVHIEAYRPHYE